MYNIGAPNTTYGVNPYTNASSAMGDAFSALQNAYGITANGNPYTYNASTLQGSYGYSPVTRQASQYNAQMQKDPSAIYSGINDYMNPYTNQVINRTSRDMNRNLKTMQTQNAANAAKAGAFGGARHGLVEADTNAQVNQQIGDMAANLRNTGWNQAAALSAQDIQNQMSVASQNQAAENAQRQFNAGNLQDMRQFNANNITAQRQFNEQMQYQKQLQNMNARNDQKQFNANQKTGFDSQRINNLMQLASSYGNMGQAAYNMGTNISDRQAQDGATNQALLQQLFSGAQEMYNQYTTRPEQMLQLRLAALGMSPMSGASTQTNTQPNTTGENVLGSLGNMVSFAPISLPASAARFKHSVTPTGRIVKSKQGKLVPEVTFIYNEDIDPDQNVFTGVVAEHLGDDPAVYFNPQGQAERVDYSQLEVI